MCPIGRISAHPRRAADRQSGARREGKRLYVRLRSDFWHKGDKKDMEIKPTHTFEELQEAAREQNLRIEQKGEKYKVVRTFSERFVVVEAGAGYSLDHDGLREFLIFNSVDIGERITDWSKEREHKRSHPN